MIAEVNQDRAKKRTEGGSQEEGEWVGAPTLAWPHSGRYLTTLKYKKGIPTSRRCSRQTLTHTCTIIRFEGNPQEASRLAILEQTQGHIKMPKY